MLPQVLRWDGVIMKGAGTGGGSGVGKGGSGLDIIK